MPEIDAYNGVRSTIKLLVDLVQIYLRHRAAVVVFFPTEAITALDALAAIIGTIAALNEPGPD